MLRIVAAASIVFAMTGGLALSQTTGTVNPNSIPQPDDKGEIPAGSCMPIGVTAAGDLVFPFQCKALLDQTRAKATADEATATVRKPTVDDAPAALEERPASRDEAPVEKQPKPPTENQPYQPTQKQAAITPQDQQPLVEIPVEATHRSTRTRRKWRRQFAGSLGCMHYRTYDSTSASYRDYRGHVRACLY